jgi:hypothetical protein
MLHRDTFALDQELVFQRNTPAEVDELGMNWPTG